MSSESGTSPETRERIPLGEAWSLDQLAAIARDGASLSFGAAARARVDAARAVVAGLAEAGDEAPNVYGVNTGFGALAETRIAANEIRKLQQNLVRSHACGVGEPLPTDAVRAMIALRAQTVTMGCSGARAEVVELLIGLLDHGVHPVIPSKGSVGASGDLAPLAHLALVLIGEGHAEYQGEVMLGGDALAAAGLSPVTLQAKEGLALINGTQLILGVGALAVVDAEQLCRQADLVGAMSLEALQGSQRPFDPRIQAVRPHPGQAASAAHLRALLVESEIMESHRDCHKVQDPYSLRCMPQIHGATRDALTWVRSVLEREIVAATDNPLIFADSGEVISGGNFHGQPLAIALDTAAIAVAELANVAERRIEQLVNPAMSSGLPPFLAPNSGLDSGFMMAQVTAAALVSENKVLCHPSSVDSIPSSAGKEDHVSMGSISARKAAQIVEHVRIVLGIEAMVAAQGIDLRAPLRPGRGVSAAHGRLRDEILSLDGDRPLYVDIESATLLLRRGALLEAADRATSAPA
ncbi:MAG: histidine ammonia-lyase [Sandaracinaceae bacterium]